ncbi:MAG: glycosyltransferase family 39 protein [Nitrospirae bacterium]|nr:glycosyltransferase family 39 protein [Nitrospirota bacterium]
MTEERRKNAIAGLLIAGIAFLVYANSLGNGFVWDDASVILSNPALHDTPLSLFSGIDTVSDIELTPYYRPLTLLIFLIEERLHGHTSFLMHLLSVLIHTANAFLVYRLARLLINDTKAALLAGLLFAVHPINTEGVDFLSGGRNTMLSGFFIIISYLVHEWSARRDNTAGSIAGAMFCLAGLFSKETALAILPVIGFVEIPIITGADPVRRRNSVGRLIPYAVCTAVYLALRNNALSNAGVRMEALPGLAARLLDNLYIIPKYIITIICPTALSPIYYVPEDLNLLALPLAAAWLCIIGILVWLLTRGRSRAAFFGLFWFTAFWLPVSGIIPIPSAPLADRFMYVPAIGIWLVIADQVFRLLSAGSKRRWYGVVAVAIVIFLLAALTVRRNLDWKKEITLFARAVEQYPDNAGAHAELGRAYYHENRQDDKYLNMAEQEFKKALALDPTLHRVHTPIGSIRFEKGDYEAALYHYTEALTFYPFEEEARIYRGMVLEKLGRDKEAVADYQLFLATPGRKLGLLRPYAEERVRDLTNWHVPSEN